MDKFCGSHYDEIGNMLHGNESQVGMVVGAYFKDSPLKRIKAVDLGIGTGHTTAAVLEVEPRIHVFGVDNSEERLSVARERFRERVTLVNEDLRDYLSRKREGSFDLVYSGFTLHGLTSNDRFVAYSEIYNALKEGGLFVDYDVSVDRERGLDNLLSFIDLFSRALKDGKMSQEEFIIWMNHLAEERSEGRRMYVDERLKCLEDVGFWNKVEYVDSRIDSVLISSRK